MPFGTPKYVTADEVRTLTLVEAIQNMTDDKINPYIIRAEERVDMYVKSRPHHPDDPDTYRVFPRKGDEDEDGTPLIPHEVMCATIISTEHLILGGAPKNKDYYETPLKSERIDASGYSYTRSDKRRTVNDLLPAEARAILDKIIRKTYMLSVD